MKVYEALYNPMTEESSYGTLSIHKSKRGALKAVKRHKAQELKDHNDRMARMKKDAPEIYKFQKKYPFDQFKDWDIREIDLLD